MQFSLPLLALIGCAAAAPKLVLPYPPYPIVPCYKFSNGSNATEAAACASRIAATATGNYDPKTDLALSPRSTGVAGNKPPRGCDSGSTVCIGSDIYKGQDGACVFSNQCNRCEERVGQAFCV